MTDLLSREKEFLKLNERLEKLATTVLEQQQQQAKSSLQRSSIATGGTIRSNSQASSTAKTDTRFYTYTKAKGQTTLLKKRGAGDGSPEGATITARERAATLPARGDQANPRVIRNQKIKSPRTGPGAGRYQSDDASIRPTLPYDPISTGGAQRDNQSLASSNVNSIRKNIRTQDSSSRSFSRGSSIRTPRSQTFTIKYRNPKFVQSPSLEVLVKEESATLRRSINEQSKSKDEDSSSSNFNTFTKKNVSTDSIIKFLKSKVAILEEDHDRISQEMSQQKELLEKAIERQKKVELQRDQAYLKNNAVTEQLAKVESQLEDASKRARERVLEQSGTQKELERVKRELKILTQTNTNLERRLYRANEELENAKTALTLVKNMERDMKETMRQECESKDNQIKSLKKQRADLLNAYKKQLFLIDNLKRQNTCMEQSKMIGFGEKEFTKVLEWNAKT